MYQCMPNRDKTTLTDDDELTMLTRVMMDLEMRVSARWTHMSWNTPKACPGIALDIFETGVASLMWQKWFMGPVRQSL